jgi:hypothetical protein
MAKAETEEGEESVGFIKAKVGRETIAGRVECVEEAEGPLKSDWGGRGKVYFSSFFLEVTFRQGRIVPYARRHIQMEGNNGRESWQLAPPVE